MFFAFFYENKVPRYKTVLAGVCLEFKAQSQFSGHPVPYQTSVIWFLLRKEKTGEAQKLDSRLPPSLKLWRPGRGNDTNPYPQQTLFNCQRAGKRPLAAAPHAAQSALGEH
jgi:hypothetical protein